MFEQNISSPFITNVTDIQQQTTKASPLRTQAKIAIKTTYHN